VTQYFLLVAILQISDHQRSYRYEDGPWKGPEPPLLVAADLYFVRRVDAIVSAIH
jgi:hypothetical protein